MKDYKVFTEKDWAAFDFGKIAVNLPTRSEFMRFLSECEERGYMWVSGDKPTDINADDLAVFESMKGNYAVSAIFRFGCGMLIASASCRFFKRRGQEIYKYVPLPEVRVTLDDGARAPKYAHTQDAGLDVFSREDKTVPARGSAIFDTGVHIQIPDGYFGELKSKSGLNVNHNITSTGVIDAGYTGSMRVKLYNHGDTDYEVKTGDKISQLIIQPYYKCAIKVTDSLPDNTERGNNGFGSTGR